MKTKISVEIHASGTLNDAVIRMVTNHNEGKSESSIYLIRCRYYCYAAEWASISPKFETMGIDDILNIMENGKPTLTLTWVEIPKLEETESNLLTQNELS